MQSGEICYVHKGYHSIYITGSFPAHQEACPICVKHGECKKMKLKTTLCWMLVTLSLLSFAQAEELPAERVSDIWLFA